MDHEIALCHFLSKAMVLVPDHPGLARLKQRSHRHRTDRLFVTAAEQLVRALLQDAQLADHSADFTAFHKAHVGRG